MPTANEYRQQADACFKLADEANEVYVTEALAELAAEFQERASKIERASSSRTMHRRRKLKAVR